MGRKDRIRAEIAGVAAQLLFENAVRNYREARSQAVRRIGPRVSGSHGAHLPEYAEIHAELQRLLRFYGGEALAARVRTWRQLALKYLQLFEPFQPLLVGSVARGEVREISDINLQLFCDKPEEVGYFLERHGLVFDEAGDAEAAQFYLEENGIEIECRVYPLHERRKLPPCRVTGGPMVRIGLKRLQEILAADSA